MLGSRDRIDCGLPDPVRYAWNGPRMLTGQASLLSTRPRAFYCAVIALNIIAIATIDVFPTIEAGARDQLGFGPAEASTFSSYFMAGSVIGSVLALFWVRRMRWTRAALLALSGIAVLNVLSSMAREPAKFIALQAALGFCTSSLYALTLTVMSDQENPDRHFGLLIAGQVAFQALGLYVGPFLLAHGGLRAVLLALAALGVVGLPLLRLLPDRGRAMPSRMSLRTILRPATTLAFVGCFAFYLSTWSYWTYVELIGHGNGLSDRQIANGLTIGVAAGFCGASLASWLGGRSSRMGSLALAAAMLCAAAWLLGGHVSLLAFTISNCLFNFAWNSSVAYQYALVNDADPTGRAVSLTPAVHMAGGMTGPAIGILALHETTFNGILWLIALGVLASQLLFIFSRVSRPRSAAPG